MKTLLRFAVLALPGLLLALHRIDSADIWFHLATGERIVATHALPAVDPFGAAPPVAWIVHDWLAGVALALLYRAAGAPGLVLASVVVFVTALAWAWTWTRRAGRPTWSLEISWLVATLIASERFFVRPEMFTLSIAAIWFHALVEGAPRGRRGLAALALLQVAWTNLHAAFLLGPLAAALALVGVGLDRALGRTPSAPLPRARLALPVVAGLACLVTPYGPRLLAHILTAWRDVGGRELRAGIVEWQPTFSQPVAGDLVSMAFVASLAGIGVALVAGRRRARGAEVLLVAAMAALACTSRRHLALYAVTALPIAARWVVAIQPPRRAWFRRLAPLVLPAMALLVAIDVARGAFYERFGPPRTLGWGISAADHPLGAGEFVVQHGLTGPLFNNVAAGSYLIWRTRGELPVLVDGRLLDPARFRIYRRCLESTSEFDHFAASQGVRLVVLALQPFAPIQLLRHLLASPAWRLLCLDGEGAVFVAASVVATRSDLTPLSLAAALPPATVRPAEPARWWRRCDPGEAARRGAVLLQLGFPVAAGADLSQALLQCPERWQVGLDLAAALNARGRSAQAQPLVERALQHDAANVEAWIQLGVCRAAAGDVAAARSCWQRAAALAPTDPRPARLLVEAKSR